MTDAEFKAAFAIAQSDAKLENEDIEIFNGFGLSDFKQVVCTSKQLARLIRWQCHQLNGGIDAEALNDIRRYGRHRFVVVN